MWAQQLHGNRRFLTDISLSRQNFGLVVAGVAETLNSLSEIKQKCILNLSRLISWTQMAAKQSLNALSWTWVPTNLVLPLRLAAWIQVCYSESWLPNLQCPAALFDRPNEKCLKQNRWGGLNACPLKKTKWSDSCDVMCGSQTGMKAVLYVV